MIDPEDRTESEAIQRGRARSPQSAVDGERSGSATPKVPASWNVSCVRGRVARIATGDGENLVEDGVEDDLLLVPMILLEVVEATSGVSKIHQSASWTPNVKRRVLPGAAHGGEGVEAPLEGLTRPKGPALPSRT